MCVYYLPVTFPVAARCHQQHREWQGKCVTTHNKCKTFFDAQNWCEHRQGRLLELTDESTQLPRLVDLGMADAWLGGQKLKSWHWEGYGKI